MSEAPRDTGEYQLDPRIAGPYERMVANASAITTAIKEAGMADEPDPLYAKALWHAVELSFLCDAAVAGIEDRDNCYLLIPPDELNLEASEDYEIQAAILTIHSTFPFSKDRRRYLARLGSDPERWSMEQQRVPHLLKDWGVWLEGYVDSSSQVFEQACQRLATSLERVLSPPQREN